MKFGNMDVELSRGLDWPICPICDLPARALFRHDEDRICPQCHFVAVVQRDKANLEETVASLRDLGLCAYCGEYASDIEHVVPRRTHLKTFTVPACHECNLIAGGTLFEDFEDKRNFIQKKLRIKYKKVLNMPEWDEEELRFMGKRMKDMIRGWQAARKIIIHRVVWQPGLALQMDIE